MSERFYGHWSIEVTSVEAALQQLLVVDGDARPKGQWGATPGLRLDITGGEWTLQLMWTDPAGAKYTSDTRRTASVDDVAGLTVVLEGNDGGPDQDFNDVVVTCTYRDPDANPPMTTPLPDFSVPDGWLRLPDDLPPAPSRPPTTGRPPSVGPVRPAVPGAPILRPAIRPPQPDPPPT